MATKIFSNLSVIGANRQVRQNTADTITALERLSSGMRINSAADDPGGQALADSLRGETRVAKAAISNINDALALNNFLDSSLEGINLILERMAELATQSDNDLMTNKQRSALQREFAALGGEIDRISKTTKFNDINLLSASQAVVFQVGTDGKSSSQIVFEGVSGTLEQLRLGSNSNLNYSVIGNTQLESQLAARTALQAVEAAMDEIGIQRGAVSANESRLNSAVAGVEALRDTNLDAENKIRDVDAATELTNLLRNQILEQVQTALNTNTTLQPVTVKRLLT